MLNETGGRKYQEIFHNLTITKSASPLGDFGAFSWENKNGQLKSLSLENLRFHDV